MIKSVINAIPATKVLAKVYQEYMVENQCAFMLISQSQGAVDATVSANQTIYKEDHTVFLKIYFLPSSTLSGVLSISLEILRIFRPSKVHRPMVRMLHMIKKPGLRKPLFPFSTGSLFTRSLSSHS